MTTPAEYRQHAEECFAAMRAAVVPEVRAVLLAMAQRWSEAAERAERRDASVRPSQSSNGGARH
jgi:hypothetical protein